MLSHTLTLQARKRRPRRSRDRPGAAQGANGRSETPQASQHHPPPALPNVVQITGDWALPGLSGPPHHRLREEGPGLAHQRAQRGAPGEGPRLTTSRPLRAHTPPVQPFPRG